MGEIITDSTVWDFYMWRLAILTGDRINGCFLMTKCMAILPSHKKVDAILR